MYEISIGEDGLGAESDGVLCELAIPETAFAVMAAEKLLWTSTTGDF